MLPSARKRSSRPLHRWPAHRTLRYDAEEHEARGFSERATGALEGGGSRCVAPRKASASPAGSGRSTPKAASGVRGKAATSKKAARPKKAAPKVEPSSWRWWLLPLLVIVTHRGLRRDLLPGGEGAVPGDAPAGAAARRARRGARAQRPARGPSRPAQDPRGRRRLRARPARPGQGGREGRRGGGRVGRQRPATITVASKLRLDSEEAVVPPIGPWTAFLDSVFGIE